VSAAFLRSLVLGYLLPGSILLHQMAIRQSEELPPDFTVAGAVGLAGDEARRTAAELGMDASDPIILQIKLDFGPARCTLRIAGPHPIAVVDDRGQVSGTPLAWAAAFTRLVCLPFLFRGEQGGDPLENLLRKAGGNFEESALTLEDGVVCYLLGAGESGAGPAGLVIKKRELVPVRVWAQENAARYEVHFGDYREAFRQGGFPTRIELRANGAPIARFSATP